MRRESIGLDNKLLDFSSLRDRGFLRILDVGDSLVVVVSDPSKSLTEAVDCVRALLKSGGFRTVFLSQIEMVFFALLETRNEIVDGMPLVS